MEIKNLPNSYVYMQKVETTLKEIGKYVGNVPQDLMEKAGNEGFQITGPQFWNYIGMDGSPDNPFTIEICIPVEKNEELSSDKAMDIQGFRCASLLVNGPWTELKAAYEKLVAEMHAQGMKPGIYCRETYHKVDFAKPENNLTEIHIGIN